MSNEEEECSTPADQETRFSSLEAKLVALSSCFEALAHKFDAQWSARPTVAQNSDLEEDFLPAETVDVFDPAESVISLNDETVDLPYEDLFKDCEDCGAKVHDGVAKRIDNACTKKPPKNSHQKFKPNSFVSRTVNILKVPSYGTTFWTKLKVVMPPFKPSKRV